MAAAGAQRQQPAQRLDQSGFSGPVAAEQAHHLPRHNLQRHAMKDVDAADIADVQVVADRLQPRCEVPPANEPNLMIVLR
jgi:hypothetical protein